MLSDIAAAPGASAPGATARPQAAGLLRRVATPVGIAGAAIAGTTLLATRSPHVPGSYGMCPLLALTGLQCAACGALRATHDLAHGDIAGAWALNPLWVVAVPLLVALWVAWTRRAWRGEVAGRVLGSTSLPLVTGAVLIVYSVLRNVVPSLAAAS